MSPSSCHFGVRRASSCFQDGTHHCCVTICILHPWCIAHLQCKTLLTPAGVAVTVHQAKLPSGNMNSSLHIQIRYIFWWNCQCDPCPCIVHVIHFKLLNLSFCKCTRVGNGPCRTICRDCVKRSWRPLASKRPLSSISLLWKRPFSVGEAKRNQWLCEIRAINRGVVAAANMMRVLYLPSLLPGFHLCHHQWAVPFFSYMRIYIVCVWVCPWISEYSVPKYSFYQ